jgi:hypothetical protein
VPHGNGSVHLTSLVYTNVVLHIEQPSETDVLSSRSAPSIPDPRPAGALSERESRPSGCASVVGGPFASSTGRGAA